MSSINTLSTQLAIRPAAGHVDRVMRGLAVKEFTAEGASTTPGANAVEEAKTPNLVGKPLPARQDTRVSAEEEAAIVETVERLNDQAASLNRSIKFSVDKETGRTVIKVLDRETEEVIRQIPPEYTMEILRRMEIGAGVLLEEQA